MIWRNIKCHSTRLHQSLFSLLFLECKNDVCSRVDYIDLEGHISDPRSDWCPTSVRLEVAPTADCSAPECSGNRTTIRFTREVDQRAEIRYLCPEECVTRFRCLAGGCVTASKATCDVSRARRIASGEAPLRQLFY